MYEYIINCGGVLGDLGVLWVLWVRGYITSRRRHDEAGGEVEDFIVSLPV
jgi:hypothetical protein